MNTLGLVNVLNNDGNVLIDVAQMVDSHIQNAAIHNALAEWNETDDPFSPETTQRLIGDAVAYRMAVGRELSKEQPGAGTAGLCEDAPSAPGL